jgi:hypothetical protein
MTGTVIVGAEARAAGFGSPATNPNFTPIAG